MTQDEIIEMARQAGCPLADMKPMYFTDKQLLLMLEAFAKLVAQNEREWVNLTEEEIGELYRAGWANNMDFARAIEAKLKEKNE